MRLSVSTLRDLLNSYDAAQPTKPSKTALVNALLVAQAAPRRSNIVERREALGYIDEMDECFEAAAAAFGTLTIHDLTEQLAWAGEINRLGAGSATRRLRTRLRREFFVLANLIRPPREGDGTNVQPADSQPVADRLQLQPRFSLLCELLCSRDLGCVPQDPGYRGVLLV